MTIQHQIESEPLEIHSYAYSRQRVYLDEMIEEELENGDPIKFARQYLAASRRAVLHALERVNAPTEQIKAAFASFDKP